MKETQPDTAAADLTRNELIQSRVYESEYKRIEQAAQKQNRTISDYVRLACLYIEKNAIKL